MKRIFFFSFSWILLNGSFCFAFEKMPSSLLYLACYVIYSCRKTFKQPLKDVLQNRCSQKFCNIHRKTPVLESPFNKFAGLKACIFSKKEALTQVFPVNIAKFLRTPFYRTPVDYTFTWRWILDILELHITAVTLGHVTKRTSQQIDQNFLWRDDFFSTNISILL